MKHFFNRRETIVTEALDGLLRTIGSGDLARLDGYPEIKVVLRADWDKSKVAVVSGGGAGHEPSHAGFVGKGMLTAAVSGEIFASPSVEAVLAAIRAVTGPAGCLLIVKNYTGDRLNFGLAAEKARAEGFAVEMVIVADDIALPDIAQPRGVAGTLFVHKISGHLSEAGKDLASVAAAARAAAKDIISLGMSLSSCSIPGQPHEDRFGENDGELGLGIHGEPGVERIAVQSADKLVAVMAERLAGRLDTKADHALLINNLGSVPPLEMSLVANAVLASPLAKTVKFTIGPGSLMTALNMNGFSLSLIRLDAAREVALLAPVGPHAWMPAKPLVAPAVVPMAKAAGQSAAHRASQDAGTRRLIVTVCEKLISLEAALNGLDAKAGDGDTGSTVATGARSVLDRLDTLPLADPAATLAAVGDILSASMGGSSGVLLSIFFTAAGRALDGGAGVPKALLAGLERMTFYGGAKPGDRTVVDALEPALKALDGNGLGDAATAARRGAEATAAMEKAKAGRSAYVGAGLQGVLDPGAHAVAEVFAAAATLLVTA
ncbi:dihydroxyacetone kinase subunit DhaK [Mesorhizobium sp. BR-1-1-10]|uniref:dihydroxyacetone kinase subunit DhaK n=1 Tax=Mesorhizobium sp. BR-1-1-10 TaxID=2876660 RepID=UPI001CD132EB|nr:dihydroxyacetone kinase subunit DhaK [Mesorhizobium sp. BR-1-1-10]MBZ9976155.1 dihydroxyacetone kinase subunit DhaK [Mesorhizobium sp. BR-1-1-10]